MVVVTCGLNVCVYNIVIHTIQPCIHVEFGSITENCNQ